jgi:hypothetical protein
MSELKLFLPLAKVDVDQRLVHGVVTAEIADRAGEICDYASTKPYYEAWSAGATEASGGKSLGAVRAMHGPIAAGKLTDIAFDDETKRILVAAKIVDDDEWRKVEEGVYTGFSQGGRYVARWPDGDSGFTRYTAEPHEISLVDTPCLPSATFEIVKNGVSERRAFLSPAAESASEKANSDAGGGDHEDPMPPGSFSDLLRVLREIADDLAAQRRSVTHEAGPPRVPPEDASPEETTSQNAVTSLFGRDEPPSPAPLEREFDKALGETSALRSEVSALRPVVAALEARVAVLEARPAPAKATIRAVTKAGDVAGGEGGSSIQDAVKRLSALPSEERALALTKISLANPLPPRL